MPTLAWTIVGFITGVCVGVSWRVAFEILRGGVGYMSGLTRTLHAIFHPKPSLLVMMLMLCIVLQTAVGAFIIVNDRQDRANEECEALFNEATAKAREARVEITDSDVTPTLKGFVEATIEYQQGLRDVLAEPQPDLVALLTVLQTQQGAAQEYYDALEDQAKVAADNPYPAADYCEERN